MMCATNVDEGRVPYERSGGENNNHGGQLFLRPGATPLHKAAYNGKTETAVALVTEAGADVEAKDNFGTHGNNPRVTRGAQKVAPN